MNNKSGLNDHWVWPAHFTDIDDKALRYRWLVQGHQVGIRAQLSPSRQGRSCHEGQPCKLKPAAPGQRFWMWVPWGPNPAWSSIKESVPSADRCSGDTALCPVLGESSAQYQSKGSEKSCRADPYLCTTWQFPNSLTARDCLSYKANRHLRGQVSRSNVLKKHCLRAGVTALQIIYLNKK